jgi:hypothetical protein
MTNVDSESSDAALEAERVRLEAALARLRRELGVVEADLARVARVGPPRTGFVSGLLSGLLLVLLSLLFVRTSGHAVAPLH